MSLDCPFLLAHEGIKGGVVLQIFCRFCFFIMNKECCMIHRKMQKTDINCYQSCALHYQGNIFLPKLFLYRPYCLKNISQYVLILLFTVINSTRQGSVSDDGSFNWKTFVIVVFCVGVLCISIVVIVYVKKKHRNVGPTEDVPNNS